jgi:hypothetical protein
MDEKEGQRNREEDDSGSALRTGPGAAAKRRHGGLMRIPVENVGGTSRRYSF